MCVSFTLGGVWGGAVLHYAQCVSPLLWVEVGEGLICIIHLCLPLATTGHGGRGGSYLLDLPYGGKKYPGRLLGQKWLTCNANTSSSSTRDGGGANLTYTACVRRVSQRGGKKKDIQFKPGGRGLLRGSFTPGRNYYCSQVACEPPHLPFTYQLSMHSSELFLAITSPGG